MSRYIFIALITAACALVAPAGNAQGSSPFAGIWTLNRSLSEFPRELGFDVDWMPRPEAHNPPSGGGRGRRGTGGGGGSADPYGRPRESSEDAHRVELLTDEARNPPARLILVDTPAAITLTNELGQSRTLHATGRDESVEVEGTPIRATTTREGDRLLVLYHVDQNRDVRYTYARTASPAQLIVEVQFLERGASAGDKARRVYDQGEATETAPTGGAAGAETPSSPASPARPATEKFDERPGAELKGLKSLGILVEDLSSQAVACGLNHDEIETALSRRLTDGGLTVRKNSDDDTYVYVNIMTTTGAGGACVSRYDAFLYTHATANLSYRDRPVLVQVSLMHRGGIGSSAPVAHAAAVVRGLETYVDLFVSQIRNANQ